MIKDFNKGLILTSLGSFWWAFVCIFSNILMHLARGLSSKLIIPPCVRPSVRPFSSGKLKTYAFAPCCLKFQKIIYVFYSA